jgi:alginate O-acetyltransferase complex protein AlgI
MQFNSIQYLVFLPIVWLLWIALPNRHRWMPLLVSSYYFYMQWNAFYLTLIVASTLNDYWLAIAIDKAKSHSYRVGLLVASLVTNLGMLFVFKYWDFFNHSAASVAGSLGLTWTIPSLNVLLPVGISFYTFQTLSYTIDVYKGVIPSERHLGRFATFVAFFPQLVAGPIERAKNLLPQLNHACPIEWPRMQSGLLLILWGLFKKVVVADRLSIYVDTVYNNPSDHNGTTLLIATYAFAFQIYCDFSAYSDIAIGSARLFNVDLMVNFRSPYFATNMQEFWHRWHISLSTWLRDYLYIPLGGNRYGEMRTYINLMITMLLGGLWHGATWNFVIWGALHGVALAALRLWNRQKPQRNQVASTWRSASIGLRILFTFHFVCFTWVFFRAATLADAWLVLSRLPRWGTPLIDAVTFSHAALGLCVLLCVELVIERNPKLHQKQFSLPAFWAFAYVLIMSIILFGTEYGAQFIYFQF